MEREVLYPSTMTMTTCKQACAGIFGLSILVYGCTGAKSNEDLPEKKGGAESAESAESGTSGSSSTTSKAGNASRTNDDADSFDDDDDYSDDPYRPSGGGSGASESPMVSIQKAVLNSSCTFAPNASACTACLLRNCCSQVENCWNGGTVCVTLAGCAAKCDENSCVGGCTHQYPEGADQMQAILSCANSDCSQACGG